MDSLKEMYPLGSCISFYSYNKEEKVVFELVNNSVKHRKTFSIKRYGLLPACKMIVEYRDNVFKQLVHNGEFISGLYSKLPKYLIDEFVNEGLMQTEPDDNRFYVYCHKINNEIVYIGSGTGNRLKHPNGRSKEHRDLLKEVEFEIVKDGLTKQEALLLENSLVKQYNPKLNKSSVGIGKELKYDNICKFAYYDPSSPTYLRSSTDNPYSHKPAGSVIGCLKKGNGIYGSVGIASENYSLHRVIYCLYYKTDVPANMIVDHIDCDKANNHPSNLRLVTQQQNSTNRKTSTDSTGISYKDGYFIVSWSLNSKQYNKRLTCSKYFPDLPPDEAKQKTYELALAYRKEKIEELKLLGQYLD